MLQPVAFCEHAMQQNVTAALTALPDNLAGFKGRQWEQKERRKWVRRGGEGQEGGRGE